MGRATARILIGGTVGGSVLACACASSVVVRSDLANDYEEVELTDGGTGEPLPEPPMPPIEQDGPREDAKRVADVDMLRGLAWAMKR